MNINKRWIALGVLLVLVLSVVAFQGSAQQSSGIPHAIYMSTPAPTKTLGVYSTIVTITIEDENGAGIPGLNPTLYTDTGTLAPLADIGNGRYTANFASQHKGVVSFYSSIEATTIFEIDGDDIEEDAVLSAQSSVLLNGIGGGG